MKRPRPAWQAERARTAQALRARERCEYTPGCEGKAMGILAKQDPFRLLLACVQCAADAQRAQRERT
ncbi:MAG TPA: hypothetical protein VGI97_00400 [Gemmatimonadaceae bacterium]|jgi:hypothetical protein